MLFLLLQNSSRWTVGAKRDYEVSHLNKLNLLTSLCKTTPFSTIHSRKLLTDLTKLTREVGSIPKHTKLPNRLLRGNKLNSLKHPAHNKRNINKELSAQKLRVCELESLDRGFGTGFDGWVHADEGDVLVVVDLDDLVWIGLPIDERGGGGGEVEGADGELHDGGAPLHESGGLSVKSSVVG